MPQADIDLFDSLLQPAEGIGGGTRSTLTRLPYGCANDNLLTFIDPTGQS